MTTLRKISSNGQFLAGNLDGDLLQTTLRNVQELSSKIRTYPVAIALRIDQTVLLCIRSAKEASESTESFLAALISAYSPDEIVVSFAVNFGIFMNSKPPQAAAISVRPENAPEMIIYELIEATSAWKIGRPLGRLNDLADLEYACKGVIESFTEYRNDGRGAEARQALEAWMPDVVWGFNCN